jgi:hypothetical protein
MPEPHRQPPPTDPASLSGQQLQALQKGYTEAIVNLGKRMEVRDRALDQACRLATTSGFTGNTMELAQLMFDFLTADLKSPPPVG